MFLEALMKVFNSNKEDAHDALGMLVGLMEDYGSTYGCEFKKKKGHRRIFLTLLDALRKEYKE